MHKVWRERRVLLTLVDWLIIEVIRKVQPLEDSVNLFDGTDVLIGLDARQTHRVEPFHGLARVCDHLRAL